VGLFSNRLQFSAYCLFCFLLYYQIYHIQIYNTAELSCHKSLADFFTMISYIVGKCQMYVLRVFMPPKPEGKTKAKLVLLHKKV